MFKIKIYLERPVKFTFTLISVELIGTEKGKGFIFTTNPKTNISGAVCGKNAFTQYELVSDFQ